MPSTAAWREEGCIINGVKISINAGLILDNRTFWQVGEKCALHPLVTVTRDAAQPINGPATRFDTATELVTALYNMQSNAGGQAAFAKLDAALRGEAIPPIFPAGAFIKTYPGKMVVVDESIASGIFLLKGFAGHADKGTAMLLPAPTPASTATALTGEWWNQPGLLPTSPQGNITTAGRDAAGNCRVNQNNKPLVAAPAGSVILTDTTRAFAVLADCKVEPLITLPQANSGTDSIAVAGGGIRNPGPISTGPNPGVGQASASGPTQTQKVLTAATLVAGTGILLAPQLATAGVGTSLAAAGAILNPVTLVGGVVIITGTIALNAWFNQQSSGIDDKQLGQMATPRVSREGQVSSPTGPQWQPPPDCPEPGQKPLISSKIQGQLARRGWSEATITEAFNNPFKVARAVNKATWANATAYFIDAKDYVVIDNLSGTVLQVSDRTKPNWAPDDTFENPRENPQHECRKTSSIRGNIQTASFALPTRIKATYS